MIELATKVMFGNKLKDTPYGIGIYKKPDLIAVKVPVFSTEKLSNVEVSLGPEMRSTGEVLGIAKTLNEAIYKGLLGSNKDYTSIDRKVLVTVNNHDKDEFKVIAERLVKQGYKLVATEGTHLYHGY